MSLAVVLRHAFEGFDVDLSFEAGAGLTAVFGPSGAGKTTLVEAVAGLLRPSEGRITLGGRVLFDAKARLFVPAHQRRIGYVFQEPRLFPHLTVRQNLRYGGWARRAAIAPARFDQIVDLLGLGALLTRLPVHLSGGEKARVAFGRAVLSNPELLIMDEPLAALDRARKQTLLPFIEGLRDEMGVPILYISHSAGEVARLADQVVRLEGGRVVSFGPAAEFVWPSGEGGGPEPPRAAKVAGVVLSATLAARSADGVVTYQTAAGPFDLPDEGAGAVGQARALYISARDVVLARTAPQGVSCLNIWPVRVQALRDEGASTFVEVAREGVTLVAHITQRSRHELGLSVGDTIFALLKGVALAET